MFESTKQYLQDWSDACEYAAECWPDTPFGNMNQMHIGEPWTALGTIAVACFLVWAINERALAKRARQAAPVVARPARQQAVIRDVKQQTPTSKLAA